jgi:hypothetical protein
MWIAALVDLYNATADKRSRQSAVHGLVSQCAAARSRAVGEPLPTHLAWPSSAVMVASAAAAATAAGADAAAGLASELTTAPRIARARGQITQADFVAVDARLDTVLALLWLTHGAAARSASAFYLRPGERFVPRDHPRYAFVRG